MEYKSGFFFKEFRQAYSEYKISLSRMILFGAFLGLLAFSFHFLLQTVYDSVLTRSVPELMLPSYFSVLFAYINIAYIFFLIYFLASYKYLTFSEIRDNSWYLLVKMGYDPLKMIMIKLSVRVLSVLITFSVGFGIALLLTVFLKYPFVPDYFLPLFVAGFFDILIIVMVTMTSSLFIALFDSARLVIVASALILFFIKIFSGYYSVVSNRTLMRDPLNLIRVNRSAYFLIFVVFILSCLAVCIYRARFLSQYYHTETNRYDEFALQDYKTDAIKEPVSRSAPRISRKINIAVMIGLTVLVSISIVINLFVLFVGAMSPDKEFDVMGHIPYIFRSSLMQPSIEKNDLVFFRRVDPVSVDPSYVPEVDTIVLFRHNNAPHIERIIEINEDGTLLVDIDYYPPMSQKDALRMRIETEQIYGQYSGRSRWLGAIVLFANSFFGRLLLLLIPAILIFFYKPIIRFFGLFSKTEKA
ncbi:MAG: S26 family signal peptidase [Clostridiaceae bacterium]|nr:S26 family signal peptidase [Clostridiaceae bacterium]